MDALHGFGQHPHMCGCAILRHIPVPAIHPTRHQVAFGRQESDDLGTKPGLSRTAQRGQLMGAVDTQARRILAADAQDEAFSTCRNPIVAVGQAGDLLNLNISHALPDRNAGDDFGYGFHFVYLPVFTPLRYQVSTLKVL